MFFDGGHMVGLHGLWWLFWLLLVAVLVFAGWGSLRRRGRVRPRESPHEVLRRRLASGEITAQDYEERKRLLDRDVSGGP